MMSEVFYKINKCALELGRGGRGGRCFLRMSYVNVLGGLFQYLSMVIKYSVFKSNHVKVKSKEIFLVRHIF